MPALLPHRRLLPPAPRQGAHGRARRVAVAAGATLATITAVRAAAPGSDLSVGAPPPAATCSVRQSGPPPRVVELYTSEGCSSCPPADRWLSTLTGRRDVLPLAFHVDYWDRLGWADRFASREGTQRQSLLARHAGAASVYTPQVIVDGRDWRGWPRLPAPGRAATGTPDPPALTLRRHGDAVVAEVGADAGRARLAGYWAVVEDAHASRVAAGENAGETLHHDHVVRLYRPLDAWPASGAQPHTLRVLAGDAAHPRRVVFVVTDPATLQPLQAAALPIAGDC